MSPHSKGTINIESKYSDDATVKQSDENYCLALGKTSEGFELDRRDEADVENNMGEYTSIALANFLTHVLRMTCGYECTKI